MITKMTKYTFLLLSSDTEAFLREIQELGVLDIQRSRKPVDAVSGKLYKEAEELRKEIETVARCDYERDEKHHTLSTKLDAAEEALDEKRHWGDLDPIHVKALREAGCRLHFYTVPVKKYNPAWAEQYAIQEIERDGKNVRFVLVDRASEGANNFQVPETRVAVESLAELARHVESLKTALTERENEMEYRKQDIPVLRKAYAEKAQELQRYLAHKGSETAADDYISVLTGFAPTENDASLREQLDQKSIYYIAEPAQAADKPPIRLKNNWFARNFETLTGMYGMPVYDEFDPTPILAPFFLLFWSFCMGDAGYGLILIALGILLHKTNFNLLGLKKHWRLVTTLGVGTFVIGLFLGTFFGINLKEISWIPEGLRKLMLVGKVEVGGTGYDIAMIAAIAIGVFHICLAQVIKAASITKRAGFKQAISTWGWVLLIVGGLIVAGLALTHVLNALATKIAIIAIGVLSVLGIFIFNKPGRNPLLNIGAGLWDTYQVATGLLGDVLSYIRLYALGLAGGMLGGAFNDIATMTLGDNPTWQWLAFVLIVLLGHALNFAMSCLGAFVHPLRLTFVEYFKNSGYEGKGMDYKPLTNEIKIENK
ncbi:MAG: ATPase V [Bacteroidales bacterium]|nr:ATPase V [Bacteroidales bacterium]